MKQDDAKFLSTRIFAAAAILRVGWLGGFVFVIVQIAMQCRRVDRTAAATLAENKIRAVSTRIYCCVPRWNLLDLRRRRGRVVPWIRFVILFLM